MTFVYKKRQGASALAGLVYGWASPVPHPQNRTTEYRLALLLQLKYCTNSRQSTFF